MDRRSYLKLIKKISKRQALFIIITRLLQLLTNHHINTRMLAQHLGIHMTDGTKYSIMVVKSISMAEKVSDLEHIITIMIQFLI